MNNDKPKIKKADIACIKGKDVLSYAGRLDFAHQHGIQSLETSILQFPTPENSHTAICAARLVTQEGRTFMDIGDANPDNVPAGCSESYIRMASTRAKARVLNDGYNICASLGERDDSASWSDGGPIIEASFQESTGMLPLPAGGSGGGRKPASAKQQNLIARLGLEKGQNPEALAMERFGKGLGDLHGSEADILIKSLNTRGE